MSHLDRFHAFVPAANMSSRTKEICSLAVCGSWLVEMLWERFLVARLVAPVEMSTPQRWRDGMRDERSE